MIAVLRNALHAPGQALSSRVLDRLERRNRHPAVRSPSFVKIQVPLLEANANETSHEAGTFLSRTTQMPAKSAGQVHSVEPQPEQFAPAVEKFAANPNVKTLNSTGERVLPAALFTCGCSVNLTFDGHGPEGITYRGEHDTSVIEELAVIEANTFLHPQLCVLVNGVRCFDPSLVEFSTYSPLLTFRSIGCAAASFTSTLSTSFLRQ